MRRTTVGAFRAIAFLLVFGEHAHAEPEASGIINLDAAHERENLHDVAIDARGQVRVDSSRYYGTKGRVQVEASSRRRMIELERAFVNHRVNKGANIVFGYGKKILGFEYQQGQLKRLTIVRSPVYQKMQSLGLVGRHFHFRTNWKFDRKYDHKLSVSTGVYGPGGFSQMLSLRKTKGQLAYGAWLRYDFTRVDRSAYPAKFRPTPAVVVSGRYKVKKGRVALEGFWGGDAQRSTLNRLIEDYDSVYFAGLKLEGIRHFSLGEGTRISPLFQTSLWADDLSELRRKQVQVLGGVILALRNRLDFMFNAQVVGVTRVQEPWKTGFEERSARLRIRYRF